VPATRLRRTGSSGRQVIKNVPSAPERSPEVTVVVPAYNYARYLPACVDSVLGQQGVRPRLVIIDDCSSDDTPAVTARIAADRPDVTVVRHDPNRGHIPSVNEGFGLVDTPYVVKLDADDLLAPGALARATALLEAQPDVSFVYGRPQHFSGEPPRGTGAPTRSWTIWEGRDWVARRCRGGVNVISQPEVVIRASALRRALPIREELPHTSDLHLWLQLASLGRVGRINGPAQGYYRVHDQSMQRSVHAGILFDLRGRRAAFDSVFAAEAGTLAGATGLHDAARRRLAADALDRACRAYDRGRAADEDIDGLTAFATETWPAATDLPEYARLQARMAAGPDTSAPRPRYLARALTRRAGEEVARWRWQRTGELG
jgi:hypothetical protein